ncbi:MAG: serine/threonine-protein kinase [Planctomycetota bacterium]|nr:serine/threonine-protein kinase [Planctomycetota bacterium]
MTAKNETRQRDDQERLDHPIDPLIVAAYRSMMPNWTIDSTRPGAQVRAEDTAREPGPAIDGQADLDQLRCRYEALVAAGQSTQISGFRLLQRLGQGGQGVVFLANCTGADGFTNEHLALKLFSPHRYPCIASYERDMRRMARVASVVAGIDQGNVLDVHHFKECEGIRMMIMKRVKGYDLRQLMNPVMLECVKLRDPALWTEITKVVAVPGSQHTKFTPGAAVALIRSCLEGLDKLHSRGIVHGDVKPSNIMVSPEGDVRLVDTGSAFDWQQSQRPYFCTPRYAALEVLEEDACTPSSDLASLGYVLVELLTGCRVFPDRQPASPREALIAQEASTGVKPQPDHELAEEKRHLPNRLGQLLNPYSFHLQRFCRKLIEPDPARRFTSAREAELFAYVYVQELERAGLACHFHNEFRRWLEAVQPAPESGEILSPGT